MNTKEAYKREYRMLREFKYRGWRYASGSRVNIAAWRTYHDRFERRCEDPLMTRRDDIEQALEGRYNWQSLKEHMRLMYHFNTDYTLSFPA